MRSKPWSWRTVLLFGWMCSACSANDSTKPGARSVSAGSYAVVAGAGANTGIGSTAGSGFSSLAPPTQVWDAGTGIVTQPPPPVDTGTPISIDECTGTNAAGLAAADVDKLLAGGGAPAKWLYPYDGTVFPRGLGSPLLMWDGPADAIYVHIKSQMFEYKACLKPTAAGQFQLPQDVWQKAGQKTLGKSDPYSLELTTLAGGTANGPSTEHFIIAQANIKGSLYYNSYNSRLAGGFGGVVLRIQPGNQAELFISNPGCNGCHTVSANGSRMLSQVSIGGGQSFALTVGGPANPAGTAAGPRTAWGALYPDGSRYLASSAVIDVGNTIMGGGGGGPRDATLYDTATGQVAPSTGIPGGALMPNFAPDGTLLVFNDYALDTAHGLSLMNYDVTTHTATPNKTLAQEAAGGALRPGWPFVLPDDHGIIFVRTDARTFSGEGAGIAPGGGGGLLPGGLPGGGGGGLAGLGGAPSSDLYVADIASGTVTMLAKAMGYATPADAASDTTYLSGPGELHHNFFPTVSPVAAGGYFWVFFDSLRNYGNLGQGRQLWSTAVEIQADGSYVTDHSNPPFYVPGQEFGTGNHRAFTALDPCKMDGDTCSSGIDCCGGFCYKDAPGEFTDTLGSCSPKMTTCAKRDERCTRDTDCCPAVGNEPPNTCIGGYCAFISVN